MHRRKKLSCLLLRRSHWRIALEPLPSFANTHVETNRYPSEPRSPGILPQATLLWSCNFPPCRCHLATINRSLAGCCHLPPCFHKEPRRCCLADPSWQGVLLSVATSCSRRVAAKDRMGTLVIHFSLQAVKWRARVVTLLIIAIMLEPPPRILFA